MPEMDGVETLKKMKEMKDNKSADTPVISLSANDLSDERRDFIANGYSDILSKPVNPEELENMLMNYISSDKIRLIGSGGDQ